MVNGNNVQVEQKLMLCHYLSIDGLFVWQPATEL